MRRFFALTGCSGGGKSTLVAALAAAGVATVPEPGRRIVAAALAGDGGGLPWQDPVAFARRALALALQDWQAAPDAAPVVFDRGLIDAVAAHEHATGHLPPEAATLAARYRPLVFFTPPWPALFAPDPERRHGFDAALDESRRLMALLPRFGFRPLVLPRVPVAQRVALVRAHLA